MSWQPGDRVELLLPDCSLRKDVWIQGTVREVDPLDLRPGVVVDLDRRVNGINDCFAAHSELRYIPRNGDS